MEAVRRYDTAPWCQKDFRPLKEERREAACVELRNSQSFREVLCLYRNDDKAHIDIILISNFGNSVIYNIYIDKKPINKGFLWECMITGLITGEGLTYNSLVRRTIKRKKEEQTHALSFTSAYASSSFLFFYMSDAVAFICVMLHLLTPFPG